MKQFILFNMLMVLVSLGTVQAQCCNNSVKATACATPCGSETARVQQTEVSDVQVVYFHATRRCATCQAVESVTLETLKDVFANKVPFQSINREEDGKNPLIAKYKVSGQTLLIIKGDKVVDLTNDAFLYARIQPEKFKEKLKSTIESI